MNEIILGLSKRCRLQPVISSASAKNNLMAPIQLALGFHAKGNFLHCAQPALSGATDVSFHWFSVVGVLVVAWRVRHHAIVWRTRRSGLSLCRQAARSRWNSAHARQHFQGAIGTHPENADGTAAGVQAVEIAAVPSQGQVDRAAARASRARDAIRVEQL